MAKAPKTAPAPKRCGGGLIVSDPEFLGPLVERPPGGEAISKWRRIAPGRIIDEPACFNSQYMHATERKVGAWRRCAVVWYAHRTASRPSPEAAAVARGLGLTALPSAEDGSPHPIYAHATERETAAALTRGDPGVALAKRRVS